MEYKDILRQFVAADIISITTQAIQEGAISKQDITDFVSNAPTYLEQFAQLTVAGQDIESIPAGPQKTFYRYAQKIMQTKAGKEYANTDTNAMVDKKLEKVYDQLAGILANPEGDIQQQFKQVLWQARDLLDKEADIKTRKEIYKRINALEKITQEFVKLTEQQQKEAEKLAKQMQMQERLLQQGQGRQAGGGGNVGMALSRLGQHLVHHLRVTEDPNHIVSFILQGMFHVGSALWQALKMEYAQGFMPALTPKPAQGQDKKEQEQILLEQIQKQQQTRQPIPNPNRPAIPSI